jgi:putative ABC transport system substrate-binding protein
MLLDQMKRRQFITIFGGAGAWSIAARAQQPGVPVIGFLYVGSPEVKSSRDMLSGLRMGLAEAGYVEGRNLAIEYRWTYNGDYSRLSELAADLVRRQVAVIVSIGSVPTTLAAKAATANTTIPVVFGTGGDPVELGFVESMNRPGGNLTGVANLNTEILPKRLELLHELLPATSSIAALLNRANPAAQNQLRALQAGSNALGLRLNVLHATDERDIEAAFRDFDGLGAGGLVIAGDGLFVIQSEKLAALALRHRMPAVFQFPAFAAAGGLMSYGASRTDARVVGLYVGRILKGERAADLPVQQATQVELIINLKTAKALGITVPLALLARADELIQ